MLCESIRDSRCLQVALVKMEMLQNVVKTKRNFEVLSVNNTKRLIRENLLGILMEIKKNSTRRRVTQNELERIRKNNLEVNGITQMIVN